MWPLTLHASLPPFRPGVGEWVGHVHPHTLSQGEATIQDARGTVEVEARAPETRSKARAPETRSKAKQTYA